MARKLTLPAIKISQPSGKNREIFLSKIKIGDLIDTTAFKIHYWDPKLKGTKEQGYQRELTQSRTRKVASYIEKNNTPIFPTSVLINSRTPLTFNGKELIINSKNYPLYIVDGQHRIGGLRYSIEERGLNDWKAVELPVIFLSNFKKMEEVNQFHVLNTTQKGVKTDLSQRLNLDQAKESESKFKELEEKGKLWESKALNIVDHFNEKKDSLWKGRIRLPNEKRVASHISNQSSFVKSLRPLLKHTVLSTLNTEACYEALNNYWKTIKRIFPDTFVAYKDYVILKTPGIFSLHDLAYRILSVKGESCKTENDFYLILEKVFANRERYDNNFWMRDNHSGAAAYGSMKGFKILANEFAENLPWSQSE